MGKYTGCLVLKSVDVGYQQFTDFYEKDNYLLAGTSRPLGSFELIDIFGSPCLGKKAGEVVAIFQAGLLSAD